MCGLNFLLDLFEIEIIFIIGVGCSHRHVCCILSAINFGLHHMLGERKKYEKFGHKANERERKKNLDKVRTAISFFTNHW